MSLTREQGAAVASPGSVAVTAGAGTGKTHMLTERYLHHLATDRLMPLQIVAATFTERAAAELRGRIRQRLREVPALSALTAELEAAQIGTLHSLAGRICREHPDAAGVPFDFSVQDELDQRLWFEANFRKALATLPPRLTARVPFTTLAGTVRALLADPYTAGLALAADRESWPELLEAERRRVFMRISARPAWRQAIAALEAYSGPPEDKMESQRSAALAAVTAFSEGSFTAEACSALDSLHRGRGSKNSWGEEELARLKDACGTVRDAYREGKYVFELRLGPADDALRSALPDVAEAYDLVREYLEAIKQSERLLDFNDLELRALRALGRAEVVDFYRRRWKAFLVDEFQDTNPVQAELLARLTGIAAGASGNVESSPRDDPRAAPAAEHASSEPSPIRLTVVGDEKQSIYGFRRADLSVFREVRGAIGAMGGEVVRLSTSFRTHQSLLGPINQVVAPGLAELHQELSGARTARPGDAPFLTVHLVTDGPRLKQFRQRAEAHLLGELIDGLLAGGTVVHDKGSGDLRPARPGDIAILTRTWDSLGPYGDELAARGIPTIHAGGGNLLDQREAKDAIALLRFLADCEDDLALAAVLRSPFFALPDRSLLALADEARATGSSWWSVLAGERPTAGRSEAGHERDREEAAREQDGGVPLAVGPQESRAPLAATAPAYVAPDDGASPRSADVLAELVRRRPHCPPSELLARADELTGYSAVIANLPGGPRRLADWRGMIEFLRKLELGHADVFGVTRALRALAAIEGGKVPRPGMEAGDAVSLMSVHNAKGLEWPIVVLPDMTAGRSDKGAKAVFEAGAGLAFKLADDQGEELEPVLYTLLNERRKQRDADEEMRVLYVAITRARDRVILSASSEAGGRLAELEQGLEAAGVTATKVPFDPLAAVPKVPRPEPAAAAAERLIDPAGPGLSDLPVSALSSYRVCPKRFEFEHIRQHPGASEHNGRARRVGILAHKALEREITDPTALATFDPTLPLEEVQQAQEFALRFRETAEYAAVRNRIRQRELRVAVPIDGFLLRGVVDAVGDDFVLDYKTGARPKSDSHLLQVAVYAEALERPHGHLAYLAEGTLESVPLGQLTRARQTVRALLAEIANGEFEAAPSPGKCRYCPFEPICPDSAATQPAPAPPLALG